MLALFKDDAILVINKPHGQHTQGTPQGDDGSVIAEAQERFGDQTRIVHRLDRDAGGLLVLARSKSAAATLTRALAAHEVQRSYHAVIHVPLVVESAGVINKALSWSGGRCWVDPHGAPAVTHYKVLSRDGKRTLLQVRLETGRMHQIRVHLADALAAIEGDRKYGGPKAPQLALRAVRLAFAHPQSGRWMEFELDEADQRL